MSLINYMQISLKALLQNRVRTMLTLLGIVIGIGSVISLLALSGGATQSITGQLSSFNTNNVSISAGTTNGNGPENFDSSGSRLLDTDVLDAVENKLSPDLYDAILPSRSSSLTITYKDKIQTSSVLGVDSKYFVFNTVTIDQGRVLTESEIEKGSNFIVVPTSTTDKLFNKENPIGKSITIDSKEFEIIGTTTSSGAGASQSIIPLKQMQNNLVSGDNYSGISITAKSGKANEVKDKTKAILLKYYDVEEDDANFTVETTEGLLSTVNTITSTLSILLVAIGGISLLVGGIGIMNIMLVTVSERTKEIGLRKALGAKVKDILTQFLMESIIITLIGGLMGIGLGWIVSLVSTYIFKFPAPLTTSSILLAVGVSSAIGVIFGFYPAWKASKLQPIDALKSE
jgi:putative ABC transport system permease protein